MSKIPKVSVIIPTHNRAALLPRAVSSVLAQTYGDFELLIIDDASTDDTPQVIAGFSDRRIRSFRQDANRGASAARNLGLANALGEYIAFLDDDDEYVRTRLEEQVAFLDAAPLDIALVHGWMERCDDSTGQHTPARGSAANGNVFETALSCGRIAVTITILARASVVREMGGFREDLSIGEEGFLLCTIAEKYNIGFLPQVAAIWHVNHRYPRLTASESSNRAGLDRYFQAHIERFSPHLESRPKVFAYVQRRAAVHAMECGGWRRALSLSLKAFRLHPLYPGNPRHLLRMVKVFIFWTTPVSRYRDRVKAAGRALGLRKA